MFKTKEKMNMDEKEQLGGEEIEELKEIKYLDVVLDNIGEWERENR
jgi:hypothetical protein